MCDVIFESGNPAQDKSTPPTAYPPPAALSRIACRDATSSILSIMASRVLAQCVRTLARSSTRVPGGNIVLRAAAGGAPVSAGRRSFAAAAWSAERSRALLERSRVSAAGLAVLCVSVCVCVLGSHVCVVGVLKAQL